MAYRDEERPIAWPDLPFATMKPGHNLMTYARANDKVERAGVARLGAQGASPRLAKKLAEAVEKQMKVHQVQRGGSPVLLGRSRSKGGGKGASTLETMARMLEATGHRDPGGAEGGSAAVRDDGPPVLPENIPRQAFTEIRNDGERARASVGMLSPFFHHEVCSRTLCLLPPCATAHSTRRRRRD